MVGEEATDAARKKGVTLIVDGVDITQDDPNVVRSLTCSIDSLRKNRIAKRRLADERVAKSLR